VLTSINIVIQVVIVVVIAIAIITAIIMITDDRGSGYWSAVQIELPIRNSPAEAIRLDRFPEHS